MTNINVKQVIDAKTLIPYTVLYEGDKVLLKFVSELNLLTHALETPETVPSESPLTLNEYQEKAIATAIYGSGYTILYPTLGLAGESGEVANKVKKILRDKNGIFSEEDKKIILDECFDCLWYIAALCHDLGYTLEEGAQLNLDKLASRQERNMISGSGDNR